MTFQFVPLAVDGPLTGSAILRKAIFQALVPGVGDTDQLKVSANSPAGQSLLIAPGVAAVGNGYQANTDEMYVVANPGPHTVPSGSMPGSSGSTTYWLVCIVVGDPSFSQVGHPYMPSTFDPELVNTFEYVRVVLLPCSSTTTRFEQLGKNYPGLALARLALPPGTTTVNDSMLTDVRGLSRRGVLLRRDILSFLNDGLQLPNNSNGNVYGGYNVGPAVTMGASRADVKYETSAWAAGNQDMHTEIQYSIDGGASWVSIDGALKRNLGYSEMNLGVTLGGSITLPRNTSLNLRLASNVAGGGFNVAFGGVALNVHYYS